MTNLKCHAKYTLTYPDGHEVSETNATISVSKDGLDLMPRFGQALSFAIAEINTINTKDYRIGISFASTEQLQIYHLGHHYEGFGSILSSLCNQQALQDLLMYERVVRTSIKARYTRTMPSAPEQKGTCELRLYETALVIIPDHTSIERIPYSFITSVKPEHYVLTIDIEDEGAITLSHMGSEFEPFQRALADALANLSLQTQEYLKDLLPSINPATIRMASQELKDGRAVSFQTINSICPDLWPALHNKALTSGIDHKLNILEQLSDRKRAFVGCKRGLLGNLTGEYIWFLYPIYSTNPDDPGNVIVMEAVSNQTAMATYCFQITGRSTYKTIAKDACKMRDLTGQFAKTLNKCMLAINFRREPIYFTTAQLHQSEHAHYRAAVNKIPELALLRRHFIGRILYPSAEKWHEDLKNLLQFNITSADDAIWNRSDKEH